MFLLTWVVISSLPFHASLSSQAVKLSIMGKSPKAITLVWTGEWFEQAVPS